MSRIQVATAHLNIDWRRQTQIQHCIHQSTGLEIEVELRQILLQLRAHTVYILVTADFMSLAEAGLHECGVRR